MLLKLLLYYKHASFVRSTRTCHMSFMFSLKINISIKDLLKVKDETYITARGRSLSKKVREISMGL